jgi:hypothetical protein
MTVCFCNSQGRWCEGRDSSDPFKNMEEIAIGEYLSLRKCSVCNQHWQVDVVERANQSGIAIKIDDPQSWKSFDDTSFREERLILRYGGLSENTCVWSGCSNIALVDLAFCPHCALTRNNIHD